MSRKLSDYTNVLQKLFSDMSVAHKYKIVGSANLKAIRFSSDYDLNEQISPDYKKLADKFKYIFKNAMDDPLLFIVDFKCGGTETEPMRWTYADIMTGTKNGISLEDALKMDATIKLDMIAIIDNKAIELSNNFYFKKDKNIKQSLRKDIKELKKEGNYFKALKRRFSLNQLTKKSNVKLTKYFNSDVGLANKCKSDLLTLISLMEQNFKPIPLKIIKHNIQIIKYELSAVSALNISKVFDDLMPLNKNKLLKKLTLVANDILEIVNDDAKNFK
jgi:hypothetical protein